MTKISNKRKCAITLLLTMMIPSLSHAGYYYRSPLHGIVSASGIDLDETWEDVYDENAGNEEAAFNTWKEYFEVNNYYHNDDLTMFGVSSNYINYSRITVPFPEEPYPNRAFSVVIAMGNYPTPDSFSTMTYGMSLDLYSNNITNLNFLENIEYIDSVAIISGRLTTLGTAFSNLSGFDGGMQLVGDFTNVDALSPITSVRKQGSVEFEVLSGSLTDISGLSNLRNVRGPLTIGGSGSIQDLSPLKDATITGVFASDPSYSGPKLPADSALCTSATGFGEISNFQIMNYYSYGTYVDYDIDENPNSKDIFCES